MLTLLIRPGNIFVRRGRSVGRQAQVTAEDISPMDQSEASTLVQVKSAGVLRYWMRTIEMATVLALGVTKRTNEAFSCARQNLQC